VTFTHDEPSIVKESPCLDIGSDAGSSDYSKDDNSDSTIIEASARFAMDRLSSFPVSSTTGSKVSITVTPEKSVTANNIPETESSLNLSVNSHNQKRRKPMVIPFINLIEEENNEATCVSTPTWYTKSSLEVGEATHRTECSHGRNLNSHSPQLPTSNIPGSCSLSVPLLDKRLQLFCSLCKNPLGRHENHLYLTCSLISSSKVHLRFLLKKRLETYTADTEKGVQVIVTDFSFVDQRICSRIPKSTQEQGIWCSEDGCVFSTIFCPFCSNTDNLLGVQIMATNSSNVQLLDKVNFTANVRQPCFTCA
jgi:Fanconi anemia group J protein